MKIIAGPTLERYSDLFDVPIKETTDWMDSYVNHPERDFPDQFKRGEIEATEKERFASIASYIKSRIENTADSRIKASLEEEKRNAKVAA